MSHYSHKVMPMLVHSFSIHRSVPGAEGLGQCQATAATTTPAFSWEGSILELMEVESVAQFLVPTSLVSIPHTGFLLEIPWPPGA